MIRVFLFLLVAVAPAWAQENPLAPLEFLVGEFTGEGSHSGGTYHETLKGEWSLGKTTITVRTQSTMGAQTVFEDLRVFSYDAKTRKIRLRQYRKGELAIYDVVVDGKKIVFQQTASEGQSGEEWRYTLTVGEDGFSYQTEAKQGGRFVRFVGATLSRKPPNPSAPGPMKFTKFRTSIPRENGAPLAAEVYLPDGKGPFPSIVFSPGGEATTYEGYGGFGRQFASWGYVTVIVAFSDKVAEERAGKYSQVASWLVAEGDRDGSQLQYKLNTNAIVAAGHSRGGSASVLAARADGRFTACVAVAPAGPAADPGGDHTPPSFVIVGTRDSFLGACQGIYGWQTKPRFLLTVAGMNHMLAPGNAGRHVIARATAFLNYKVKGERKFRAYLVRDADGVTVKSEE